MQIKIYLSSFNFEVLKAYKSINNSAEMNILLSYGTTSNDYYDMIVRSKGMINSLILDSGAFSLNNIEGSTGKPIDIDGFIEYCKTFKEKFDFIFNFDEDFSLTGFEKNYKNQKKIEAAGIEVVPVVHDYIGEEVNELDEYLKHYKLVSLGFSKHKSNKKDLKSAVTKIKQAKAKVHLLGISAYDRLKDLPVDYSDSSNWAQGQAFGFMYYWNAKNTPNKPELTLRFKDFEPNRTENMKFLDESPYFDEIMEYLKSELGISHKNLYGQNATLYRQLVNTHYFVKMQDRVREAHIANGFDTQYP